MKLHPFAITEDFLNEKVFAEFARAKLDYEILPENVREVKDYPEGDFVLVLGGDGTFLAGALVAHELDIPILGLEIGHLGFLCQLGIDKLPSILSSIKAKDYDIELRYALSAKVRSGKGKTENHVAINDVVIGKSELTRLISISCYLNEDALGAFKADGVIVASATGSTAYSLSAGGPIVEPTLPVILITPICAHSLYAKPLVVGKETEVRVCLLEARHEVHISLDGYIIGRVEMGDEVSVSLSGKPLKLARLDSPSFLSVLRSKFGWGFDFTKRKDERN